jgi:hypothetical protein
MSIFVSEHQIVSWRKIIPSSGPQLEMSKAEFVGWAKRSVPTNFLLGKKWWARRKSAFAHPSVTGLD